MSHQEELSVIATIKPGHVEERQAPPRHDRRSRRRLGRHPFGTLTGVHFARLVVFDEPESISTARPYAAQLALMNNIDAPLDAHLQELATLTATGLDEVFGHCEGYPEGRSGPGEPRRLSPRHQRPLESVLRQSAGPHRQRRSGRKRPCGVPSTSISIPSICRASPLKRSDARSSSFVRSRPDWRWALAPAEEPSPSWRLKELLHLVGGASRRSCSPRCCSFCCPFWCSCFAGTRSATCPTRRGAARRVRRLRADEDYWVQNQVMAAGLFKPGLFRKFLRHGDPADHRLRVPPHLQPRIAVRAQHDSLRAMGAARSQSRRMFFSSNYDGSLESYMNDFIDKAAWGLNAIFSNGDGFPRTCFLVLRRDHRREGLQAISADATGAIAGLVQRLSAPDDEEHRQQRRDPPRTVGPDERRGDEDVAARDSAWAIDLPESGVIARILDGIPWDRLCRPAGRRHSGHRPVRLRPAAPARVSWCSASPSRAQPRRWLGDARRAAARSFNPRRDRSLPSTSHSLGRV